MAKKVEDQEGATAPSSDSEKKKVSITDIKKKILARTERAGERSTVIHEDEPERVPVYPTRFMRLNNMIGGGIRGGSVMEMFGFYDSCKTSGAVSIAADVQKAAPAGRKHVLMLNFEKVYDYNWWKILGLNVSKEYFTQLQPRNLEEGIGDIHSFLSTGEVCCIIIDSVYAAPAKARENQVEAWSKGDGKGVALGVEAVKWGEAWTSLTGPLVRNEACAIAINQVRTTMGGPPRPRHLPPPTTTPRGEALKFYSWVRMCLSGRMLPPEEYKGVDGRLVKMKVVKNKTSAASLGSIQYALIRGKGWDLVPDLIDICLQGGIIETTSPGRFVVEGEKVSGIKTLIQSVSENEFWLQALTEKAKEFLSKTKLEAKVEPDEEEEGE